MVERLRALLERPLDPSVARALVVLALAASTGFAAVTLIGGVGDHPSPVAHVGLEASPHGAGAGHPHVAPAPHPARIAGQDRQDRPGTAPHRRALEEVAAHRALQHVPYRAGGVSVELAGAEDGKAVLVVEGPNIAAARRGWTSFLGRYHDEGRSYLAHFRAGSGGRP